MDVCEWVETFGGNVYNGPTIYKYGCRDKKHLVEIFAGGSRLDQLSLFKRKCVMFFN